MSGRALAEKCMFAYDPAPMMGWIDVDKAVFEKRDNIMECTLVGSSYIFLPFKTARPFLIHHRQEPIYEASGFGPPSSTALATTESHAKDKPLLYATHKRCFGIRCPQSQRALGAHCNQ